MKIIYAFRRVTLHPYNGGLDLPPGEHGKAFLKKSKEIGFEGLELGVTDAPEKEVRDLRKALGEAGLPCRTIRGGGLNLHPRTTGGSRDRMEQALRYASWIGAPVLNTTIGMPQARPGGPGTHVGEPTAQGSSREAREEDFERAARELRAVAPLASDLGLAIAIEIHQHCLADNAWSGLHLMDLVDHPAVGLNPDLGNIYWNYDVPEESSENAIQAMAPRAKYWHCKNLRRVHFPELSKTVFLQAPLPDGEIDYRFALTAMRRAGYPGDLAVEGLRLGDQFHGDGKSVAYFRELLKEQV
ncbi:MAG: sugar phosphate isomerase/epimerase [Candidatus Latescibacteria bacterium]|nr:sugar phosphate isomerase/epimerase [Candidatus Latescibacterota bacterium]